MKIVHCIVSFVTSMDEIRPDSGSDFIKECLSGCLYLDHEVTPLFTQPGDKQVTIELPSVKGFENV